MEHPMKILKVGLWKKVQILLDTISSIEPLEK